MRLQKFPPGILQNLKQRIENQELRQRQQHLLSIFPDIPIKFIKQKLDSIPVITFHLNQTLFNQNQRPTHVYYIIEGEVKLEETLLEKRIKSEKLMMATCMTKSRTLLILSAGSLVGEIETLLEKEYQTTAKSNVHFTKAMLIPSSIFLEFKKLQYNFQSRENQVKNDQLILKKMNQLRRRKLELSDSPERDTSPETKISREEYIVQQNQRIMKRQHFDLVNLTLEAPLFQLNKPKIPALPDQEKVETRGRSISAPTKSKMLKDNLKLISTTKNVTSNHNSNSDTITKQEETVKSRVRTISFTEKNKPGQRIVWQQIFS